MTPKLASSPHRVRLLELLLVIASTFGTSILLSLYVLLGHVNVDKIGEAFFNIRVLDGYCGTASSLALIGYVLWRQGRSFRSIGFSFQWKDVLRSVGLWLLAVAVGLVWAAVVT